MLDLQYALSTISAYASWIPWHWVILVTHVIIAPLAAIHAMLYKRDSRAALGWVTTCLLFPLFGWLAYYLFGINRIRTRAKKLAAPESGNFLLRYESGLIYNNFQDSNFEESTARDNGCGEENSDVAQGVKRFSNIAGKLTAQNISTNNEVTLLKNGEAAYPAMLEAIENSTSYILLSTYIFSNDVTGRQFIHALSNASNRGVHICVIIDGVGRYYSMPGTIKKLKKAGVQVASFLPPRLIPPSLSINLRNHRKILVADGHTAFTGGMNISDKHLFEGPSKHRTGDIHFKLKGKIVNQIQAVFAEDWYFTRRKTLDYLNDAPSGESSTCCRCISDGPNEDLDKISLSLIGAISAAQKSISIQTPYFLPSREMIAALQAAALRSVRTTIIIPEKSNLPYVDWACRNLLWELLHYGIEIFLEKSPYSHSKLFIADDSYAQMGSANIDPRSLRLNFELNLEIFGEESVAPLFEYFSQARLRSRSVSLQELDSRSLPIRLRDAACWLFQPYL